jgi:hypothetical protein
MNRLRTATLAGLALSSCMLAACVAPPPAASQRAASSAHPNVCFGEICIPDYYPCDPPDFNLYCRSMYGASSYAVLLSTGDANSWRCQVGGTQRALTMGDLCLQQCGAGTIATATDPKDPHSWVCGDADVPSCANPNGSEWMTISSVAPEGVTGQAGYEVYGEYSQWELYATANQFSYTGNNVFAVPGNIDNTDFTMWLSQGSNNNTGIVTGPITPSSPVQHSVTLNTPCGDRVVTTQPLTRTYPTAAPVAAVSVSSTYVNSGAPVLLTVKRQNVTPTTCVGGSLLRIVGKQPYDGNVVLDLTFSGGQFLSKTLTVKPRITTEYSATYYCIIDPSIKSTAKATVDVYGPPLSQCPGNTPPPTFWFCRDCPYNTPPLTNTIVQTACTYDQALQLASQTTFGGTCNLADGKCPSCPNPASCPPSN